MIQKGLESPGKELEGTSQSEYSLSAQAQCQSSFKVWYYALNHYITHRDRLVYVKISQVSSQPQAQHSHLVCFDAYAPVSDVYC